MVTTQQQLPSPARIRKEEVLQVFRRRLENCRYGFMFRKVTAEFALGNLILSGCVPSFYLKQNLQELLRGIPHVERVVNEVDVVNSSGLSSVRSRKSKC
ncbi:BON domain-containing protein [Bremerella cremea]|uniref:BON domain-containing protein n=1 Tax=Bremerella cremea TaxID=1031537 RepID=A0A368KV24_9BACT|nr:BON domain-containing protein [Bremerella cremea]